MKLALVFPGQGSQYVGMGKDFYDNSAEAREAFETAESLLEYSLINTCFEGPEEELKKTSVTQPAILVASYVCFREFRKRNSMPIAAVAGHSLGEYSALLAAGSLTLKDAVPLIRKRGLFMEEAVPAEGGGMAAVLGLSRELVQKACTEASDAGIIEVANYNCPGQIVLSGSDAGLQKASVLCKEFGAKRVIPLSVSGPFHSSFMLPAGEKLSMELAGIEVNSPHYKFINNVNADYLSTPEEIRESLVKQVSSSVLWEDIVAQLISQGIDTFVEVGPGKVLTGLIKKISRDVVVLNVENQESLENSLAKLEEVI